MDAGESRGYWKESRRPLTGLVFVLPMLLAYEGMVLARGADAARNGADVWLRWLLDLLGFGQYFLLPLVMCGILLGWHHVNRDPWRIDWKVLPRMLVESVLLATLLLALARALGSVMTFAVASSTDPSPPATLTTEMASFLGAGIYEELLFRLMLLPAAVGMARLVRIDEKPGLVLAVVVTSLLFAAAHYRVDLSVGAWRFVTPYGDAWDWYTFSFRFLAGVVFCVLFVVRGFGIAAGAHACYDILTVIAASSR